jgi:hypothetical protein
MVCLLPDYSIHNFSSLFYSHLEYFIMLGNVRLTMQEKKVEVEGARRRLDEILYKNGKSFMLKKHKESLKK